MTSAFAALDALTLDVAASFFGEVDGCTLWPMAAAPNAEPQADPTRPVLVGLSVIRSEWTGSVETGDNGMGRSSGAFRAGVNAVNHIATLKVACLAWRPRKGDELTYDGEAARFRIAEVMPDGGAGLRLTLNRIKGA
jgi:hypothetical protein